MRILFVGDIMGRSGREALEQYLPKLKDKYEPDITIVNGENAANGVGITEKFCKQFYEWGVDVITTGNHVWDQRELLSYADRDKNLLRPINFAADTPGNGSVRFRIPDGREVLVINAQTRLFMQSSNDPFAAVQEIVKREALGKSIAAIFVDLHGEATSEKMSFGHYFDGKISAVVGTHTHIPTADYHVMNSGTAYMSDAGMTGDYNSVIGVEKEIAIHRFVKNTPSDRMRPSKGEATLCGAYIEVNDKTGLAKLIKPVRVGGILSGTIDS